MTANLNGKKDAYYFSHDANAHNDEKLINLRIEHDWYGYGLYWAIIELLREATGYKLKCNYKAIAYTLHCDCKKIESIINDFNLFEITKNDFFYSSSLMRRMKIKEAKSNNARNAAIIRWGGKAKDVQADCKSNANETNKKEKNETKINKTIVVPACERIRKKHPKVSLPIETDRSIHNAIMREIENGKTEDEAIDLIENGTMKYAAEFIEDNKFAKDAIPWYNGGGYLANAENKKNKNIKNNEKPLTFEEQKENWNKENENYQSVYAVEEN